MNRDRPELEYIIQMPYGPDEAMFTHLAVLYTLACMKGDVVLAMRQLKFLNLLVEEYGDDIDFMKPAFDRLRGLIAKGHPLVKSCEETGKHCHCDGMFCCICGKPKFTFTMEGEVHG